MSRISIVRATLLAGAMFWATGSYATTLEVGVQPNGTGAITTLATDSATPGTASYTGGGTFTTATSAITVKSLTGIEVNPSPDLNSSSLDVTAASSSGTAKLYVSEIGLTALNFNAFVSQFIVSTFNNTVTSITEATYASPCAATTCVAADFYSTAQLLSSQTFSGTGSPASQSAGVNPDLSGTQYVDTLVYTITWSGAVGDDHGNFAGNINLSTTPLPGALPLFASGLGAMGLVLRRRKKRVGALGA